MQVQPRKRGENSQLLLANLTHQLQGARLLLVEDNEINQELAVELLTSNGLEVTLANNGQEAIDILDRETVDGVLMDCQMPILDGYSATRRLREDPRFQDLPIIAMTANAMAGDREKALAAGMNDHIAKPIDVTEMFKTIARWVIPVNPTTPEGHIPAELDTPTLEGIDTQAGLNRLQGNRPLYFKLLRTFAQRGADFVEQFNQARTSDDPQAAEHCAHTLQGVAGNLGAKGVQQEAEALEHACKINTSTDEIDHQLEKVAAELCSVIKGVETLEGIE